MWKAGGLSSGERADPDGTAKRASEFERGEEMELMRQPLEGQLLQFINHSLRWQQRWFSLDPQTGTLRYFLKEEHAKSKEAKYGVSLVLAGASIRTSDEDSRYFSVIPAQGQGDPFKLKASDAHNCSRWVKSLRAVSQDHSERSLRERVSTSATRNRSEADAKETGASASSGLSDEESVLQHLRQPSTREAAIETIRSWAEHKLRQSGALDALAESLCKDWMPDRERQRMVELLFSFPSCDVAATGVFKQIPYWFANSEDLELGDSCLRLVAKAAAYSAKLRDILFQNAIIGAIKGRSAAFAKLAKPWSEVCLALSKTHVAPPMSDQAAGDLILYLNLLIADEDEDTKANAFAGFSNLLEAGWVGALVKGGTVTEVIEALQGRHNVEVTAGMLTLLLSILEKVSPQVVAELEKDNKILAALADFAELESGPLPDIALGIVTIIN